MKKYFSLTDIDTNIDFAFQAIRHYQSNAIFGYEALIRNTEKLGFDTIDDFFNTAFENGILSQLEQRLREIAIEKFTKINGHEGFKLFLNIDNRILQMRDHLEGHTKVILANNNLSLSHVVFEISEKHNISDPIEMIRLFENYANQGYCIAIDDFGVGFSGLKLLQESAPNIIKLDRFFISDIHTCHSKFLIAKHLIALANEMQIKTLAEGVETYEEYICCQKLGFDLIQGYYIEKPTTDITTIHANQYHTHYMRKGQSHLILYPSLVRNRDILASPERFR